MNGPENQQLIEQDLQHALSCLTETLRPHPLPGSPWVAMSVLQKAIRRGRQNLALRAAATLLRDSPARLWRRLGCIACEDVGLGDLESVAAATAAMDCARKEGGGDWLVACAVIAALARAPKCRAADDLLMTCALHPAYARQRIEFRHRSTRELIQVICGSACLQECAVALWSALGGGPREAGLRRSRSETQAVFDSLCEAGWPHTLTEVARLNFNCTGEALGPLLVLLAQQPTEPPRVEAEDFPPEVTIDETPGWAFDVYTREGRTVFTRFLAGDSETAVWLRQHVPASRRLPVLGHFVFRVEGGVVDCRLRWPLSDRLRHEVDVACAGVSREAATELLELVRADLPSINKARVETLSLRV